MSTPPSDIVSVSGGRLHGLAVGSVQEYLGIPYGRPPVGRLRFRPPEPAEGWSGIRPATQYGPAAMQPMARPASRGSIPGAEIKDVSEDCLSLNVWVPGDPSSGPRPVFVWIHGGGLVYGASSEPHYRGRNLAQSTGMVVVSLNYRLGVLGGFIKLSDLGDPRLAESQDIGLLDLVLGLEWVRDNIEAFGGNPGCVTIAGESAGGHCVGALLAMPAARGLFHRAIVQSPQWLHCHDGEAPLVTGAYERAFGGRLADSLFDADPGRILDAQATMFAELLHTAVAVPLMSSLHPTVLPEQILAAVAGGQVADIPLLVGTTTDETRNMFPRAADEAAEGVLLESLIAAMLPGSSRAQRGELVSAYTEAERSFQPAPQPPSRGAWFAADYMIRIPAGKLIRAQVRHQRDVYNYMFDVKSPLGLGAFHTLELPYLFGTTDEPDWKVHTDLPSTARITKIMQEAWSSFARDGRPSSGHLPDWPSFDESGRATMIIGPDPRVVAEPWSSRLPAWDSL